MNVAAGFSSETGLFIENALKGVREGARLDDDPVLPPLPVVSPRSKVVRLAREEIPWKIAPPAITAKPTVSIRVQKKPKRSARWPLLLCGFVASVFAGAAFMASPLGARPEVRHAVSVSKAKTSQAAHAVSAIASRVHL
jgi:hypothetical protein